MRSCLLVDIFSLLCVLINGDVSHLKTMAFGRKASSIKPFSGYHYDAPISSTLPNTFLPEIVINRESSNVYLPPTSTETPILIRPPDDYDMSVYLPPFNDEIPIQPTNSPPEYFPPETIPTNEYLPPSTDEGYVYPKPQKQPKQLHKIAYHTKSNALRIQIDNMRCLDGQDGHFQAAIHVDNFIDILPIIDTDTMDSHCQLQLNGVKFYINIPAVDFHRCNINLCGQKELCIRLRFPQILGMKSLDDGLLTLQCKLQERIVAKTHTLRVGISSSNQARNAMIYSHMGRQQLRSHISLYRHISGGLARSLLPGSAVQLGEELMLRAQIKSGDGWNHSRLSDVTLQRIGGNGELLNSAILVKSNGCINPAMQSICSIPPIFEAPLGYRLGFRVVMFQGMKSGDEMQVNVRIIGCVNRKDCSVEQRSNNDNNAAKHAGRSKRNSVNHQLNRMDKDIYEISNISFRVVLPSELDELRPHEQHRMFTYSNGKVTIFTTLIFVILLIASASVFIRFQVKRFYFVWDKY